MARDKLISNFSIGTFNVTAGFNKSLIEVTMREALVFSEKATVRKFS